MGKAKDGPYRHACPNCKSRHLKCDASWPSCRTCIAAGRTCDLTTNSFIFRHDDNPSVDRKAKNGKRNMRSRLRWSHDQDWARVPSGLKFVDQSLNLDFLDSSDGEDISDVNQQYQVNQWSVVDAEKSDSVGEVAEDPIRGTRAIGAELENDCEDYQLSPLNSILEPSARSIYEYHKVRQDDIGTDLGLGILSRNSNLKQAECLWPLQDGDEAILLRHFISDLCPWFDYCDRDRHFQNSVLPEAATDSTLLNSILAVSARHLALQGKFDRYAGNRYQQKCLDVLIPELNDENSIPSDFLFAGTIILRLLDEMTEDDPTLRFQGHGLSTRNLIRGREETLSESSLRTAALRIELRQEVIISFMTRKPVPAIAQYCNIDFGIAPSDDWTWTYRITSCLADCLNLCYDERQVDFLEEYKRLSQYVVKWTQQCPKTFMPIASNHMKDEVLPQVWFLNDCHVAAHQFLGLCRILLLAHDPTVPSIGLDRKLRIDTIDDKIRAEIRLLCGMALSNSQHVPALFTAGAAIAMCGDRFTSVREQKVLLDILIEAEAHIAWPSLRFQDILRGLWNL